MSSEDLKLLFTPLGPPPPSRLLLMPDDVAGSDRERHGVI